MRYDPLKPPDPERWLATDEWTRIEAVERYHRKQRIRPPNARLHATIHTVVENQVALGDETPAAATLQRLMSEGLDRHEAIHAIGSVLAEQMWMIQKGEGDPDDDPNPAYFAALERLTKESWYRDFGEPDEEDEG